MRLFARFNRHVFRVFAQTLGWMLLFFLIPAVLYALKTQSLWDGVQIFLLLAVVTSSALLWAFWAGIFPKQSGGS